MTFKASFLSISLLISTSFSVFSQKESKKEPSEIQFTNTLLIDHTDVKHQQKTGTCWSYSSISFIESEILRMGKGSHDLSEMYFVYHNYKRKATNYVLKHGKTQFSQGSLNHDVLAVIDQYGVVPQSVYKGDATNSKIYNHSEMEAVLYGFLSALIQNKNGQLSTAWPMAYQGILDAYMGQPATQFTYQEKEYTPQELAKELGIKQEHYVSLTSFSHHPFNTEFILEVPDNWSNGSFYNLPLNDFISALDYALENGFTVAWDADVSEKTWSRKKDIAKWPATPYNELSKEEKKAVFTGNIEEANVDQAMRQEAFENLTTTDDHLMHIVGTATDQYGNKYYLVKNSWGENREFDGFVYVSEAYMRMKTISFTLHQDGIRSSLRKKIGQK